MKNYWLNNEWCARIEERINPAWGGAWRIRGYYEDEKAIYDAAEAIWDKKYEDLFKVPSLEDMASGSILNLCCGEKDYFAIRVLTPLRYLHKDGTWRMLLHGTWKNVDKCGLNKYELSGTYDSYDEALATLTNSKAPLRFEEENSGSYQEYLNLNIKKFFGSEL